jgi:mannose-6-phosphate isomerase-like protein (cupin superfamily)
VTKWKKIAAAVGAMVGGYLLVAAVVALALPLEVPPEALRPHAGDMVASSWEKVEQRFLEQRGENLYSELTLKEGSGGPPLHYHTGFDEGGEVTEGTLSLELGGKVLTFEKGQTLHIPAGVLHRPFVQPGKHAVLRGEIPQIFAACLSQMYGTLDAAGGPGPGMMLHLSMSRAYCDTHVAPLPAEKVLFFLLNPIARVAGYKSYYPERGPKRAVSSETVAATRE